MTRLDLYLFRAAGLPLVWTLICTTAVVWLTQVLQRVDLMVEDGGSLVAFLRVTILLLPSLVGVVTPFALLAAILYALNMLATDNELPVIGAAGGSRLRIARPLILLSVLASVLVLWVNLDLQPRSYRAMKDTVQEVRSDLARAFIRSGVFTEVMDGVTIYADEVRPGDQYVGLLIHDARTPGAARTYTAESGLFKVTEFGPRLLLARGTAQRVDPDDGRVEVVRFMETAVDLASLESSPGERTIEGTERYLGELLHPDPTNAYDREQAGELIAEGHARLATPLYALAFGLLASAVLLTAPVNRRGHARRLMLAIAFAIILRTLGFAAQTAAVDTPALNVIQYLVPVAGAVWGAGVLTGRFWAVRRRHVPNTGLFPGMSGAAA
ncbi:LptF/LptG family permease [Parvularcula dongshanensis]|uniref:Lipopolysaccharide export system permease protein n=1 Tax=Parvularcula dongshanensis TaxID=1173995 RepID=A0A840I7C0_9PROT|nr:LptF/LptG family permease [Parvularcula dongshanensis]MBB4660074.1 lipopolysaccharide export system permease protein [Parvularcula dongshanensis]